MPWKQWSPGDELDAADINDYVMEQQVMIFASTSARDTALSGNLIEGMVAAVGGGVLTYYTGSAWVPLGGF